MKKLINIFGFTFAFMAIFFVSVFSLSTNVFADTIIGNGSITADTVWTKEASPYIVSDFTIPAGIKLTLEPGVVIKLGSISNEDRIFVKGELDAQGTITEPIYFTSFQDDSVMGDTNGDNNDSVPQPGDWMGIIVRNGGLVNMNYSVIDYGGYMPTPVLIMNMLHKIFFINVAYAYEYESPYEEFIFSANIYNSGGTVHITNSVIQNSAANGIHHSAGITTVENTVIEDNFWDGIYNDSGVVIDAKNNWWGDARGPYIYDWDLDENAWNGVEDDVDFTPWLIVDPTLPIPEPKKNPVIIIPGILSSYLNRNDDEKTEVWMNLIKAFSSGSDKYLDELSMNIAGQPDMSYPVMLPTDIFRKIDVLNVKSKDFFGGLINELEADGYIEGEDLFVFPYDWRLDIMSSVSNVYSPILTSLKDRVDEILLQTGAEKVDIVAHSLGGLLTKYYIKHFGEDKVDKFVDIGTPHFGAPKTVSTLMSGDNLNIKFGWFGLNSQKVKEISQNMPSLYQLLPSQAYFSLGSPDYSYYLDDLSDFDGDGITGKLSYDESFNFLENTGRNGYLLDISSNIHNDIDNMVPADYGVRAYNIVGCGTPTMAKFFSLGEKNSDDPEFDIAYISGDGTVPLSSAEAFPALEQYYAKGVEHALMPSTIGVKELVSFLLSDREIDFDYTEHSNISNDNSNCDLPDGTFLSFHSPVDVNIYDSLNNHVGPNEMGDIEQNIPGVIYDIFENNKYIYLPQGEDYKIGLVATDQGSFSAHIKKYEDGVIVSTKYFNDIPLQSISTTAEVDITAPEPVIILDSLGDGTNTETFVPSSSIEGDSLSDRTAPFTTVNIISPATSTDNIYYGDVTLIFETLENYSGILKTEYLLDDEVNYFEVSSTVIISKIGTTTITYRSIDKAGNIEDSKIYVIEISVPVIIPDPEIPVVVVKKSSSGSSHRVILPANSTSTNQVEIIATSSQPQIALVPPKPQPVIIQAEISKPKAVSLPTELTVDVQIASTSLPLVAGVASAPEGKIKPVIIFVGLASFISALVFINKRYIIKI